MAPTALAYQLVTLEGKGRAMRAARNIKSGERILSEAPLISFTPIQQDIIYEKQWLVPGRGRDGIAHANGRETFAADIRKLTKTAKTKFRRLHGTSPNNDGRAYSDQDEGYQDHDLSRIRLNAFSHPRKEGGVVYSVERVFEVISRINHSCKPNAVMSWNSNLERGTIHAITPINNQAEITISYHANPDMQFQSIKDRCKSMSQAYGFICNCTACGPELQLEAKLQEAPLRGTRARPQRAGPETGLERDMRLRLELKDLHARIDFGRYSPAVKDRNCEEVETTRLEQLGYLDKYLTAMHALGLRDSMLANVYAAQAKNKELGKHTATWRARLGNRAPANLPHDPPATFVREALEQWEECEKVHLRCSGADHPHTREVAEDVTRVKLQRLQFDV